MKKPLGGYPTVFGDKRVAVVQHSGPASYVQMGTTGDPVAAREGGLSRIHSMAPAVDATGVYMVIPIFTNLNATPANGGQTSVKCAWFTLAGMTEVAAAVDLHTKTVRLTMIGE